jgi:hypothetical protein
VTTGRAELAALAIADQPERWSDLGFTVSDERIVLGAIEVRLGGEGRGITSWTLRGLAAAVGSNPGAESNPEAAPLTGGIDGLATAITTAPAPEPVEHPNRALGIDQVVVVTPDFERTAAVLEHAAMPLRRIRDAVGFRQGFRRLGPAILELVEAPKAPATAFWGLVIVVPDLTGLGERLAPHLGDVRDAVQPGRHIAALGHEAGLSTRVAFMDPE